MTETITPLRPRGDGQSSLARIDPVAVELLAGGKAISLQAARIEAILMDLRIQRDRMATLLADLRGQESVSQFQVDATNTDLVTAINQGIVQIDLFIARSRCLVEEAGIRDQASLTHRDECHRASNAGSARPGSSGPAPVP